MTLTYLEEFAPQVVLDLLALARVITNDYSESSDDHSA